MRGACELAASGYLSGMALLEEGATAPEFSLVDEQGQTRSLSEFLAQGPVVVYFYPRDDTPGCTAESCHFRDEYAQFTEAGVAVVGISRDSQSSHLAFKEKHRLPFTLLSDLDGQVAKSFGVSSLLGLLPGRATFVLDQSGQVRLSFSSHINMRAHVDQALQVVRGLQRSVPSESPAPSA